MTLCISDDIAYAEPIAYEAARARARDAYFPNPDFDIIALMSQEQRNSITVMLVRSEWSADVAKASVVPGKTRVRILRLWITPSSETSISVS